MALEAILAVEQAEKTAAEKKAEAEMRARKILEAAEADGKKSIEEAVKRADTELEALGVQAAERNALQCEKIRKDASEKIQSLRTLAQSRTDKTAEWIAERIVNG